MRGLDDGEVTVPVRTPAATSPTQGPGNTTTDRQVAIVTGANTGSAAPPRSPGPPRRQGLPGLPLPGTRPVGSTRSAPPGKDGGPSARLGDLSVRAARRRSWDRRPLHVLINNAGLAGAAAASPTAGSSWRSGPITWARSCSPAAARPSPRQRPARIVNVSSDAHYGVPGIDFDAVRKPTRSRTGFSEYAVSKLANLLHAQELARRLERRQAPPMRCTRA